MSAASLATKVAHHMRHSILQNLQPASRLHSVQQPEFGLLFDIDGVLIRGKKPIPAAKKAFQRLMDKQGKFRVPTVFVTNAGNALAKTKAEQLSNVMGVEIPPGPVMMSHSPLRMFQEFHNKCVLLSGQGPVEEIAQKIGFTNTVTIEQIRDAFPNLDMVDHQRRPKVPSPSLTEKFPKIEAIVLFGEPVRWETNLQLLIDVLLTNGKLTDPICEFANNEKHLPILACNMDLQWMSESHMPRFGHGTFLHCLESVFEKLVGKPLSYTALMGKPSEITYVYAERLIMRQAEEMGLQSPIKTLYAVGDNPMADIYGANLYNKRLREGHDVKQQQRQAEAGVSVAKQQQQPWRQVHANVRNITTSASAEQKQDTIPAQQEVKSRAEVEKCQSILVCTGVYSHVPGESPYHIPPVFHGPRDMKFDMSLCMPSHITQDVDTALDYIEKSEGFQLGTPV